MIFTETVIILVCMVLGAFYAGIETGVISIHRVRLRHLIESGSRNAKTIQSFLDHPDRLLATVLVGVNVCVVVASIFAARLADRVSETWGKTASAVIMTAVLLVFSEYLPKAWFQSRPLERSLPFAEALRLSYHVFRPIGAVINLLTNWLIPGPGPHTRIRKPFVSREDLKHLTREMGQHGEISPTERTMMSRVFELSSRTAGQIMIPREQMTVVKDTATVGDLLQTARQTGFRRLPIYSEEEKKFTGIANIVDILSSGSEDASRRVTDFMRHLQSIPDYLPVDEILPRMRRSRQPMCLVTNIHSEVVGLVTMEDVLDEIVGNLQA